MVVGGTVVVRFPVVFGCVVVVGAVVVGGAVVDGFSVIVGCAVVVGAVLVGFVDFAAVV